jgi:hypothetical protein
MPIPRAPGTQPLFCDPSQSEFVSISRVDYDRWLKSSQTIVDLEAEAAQLRAEIRRLSSPQNGSI